MTAIHVPYRMNQCRWSKDGGGGLVLMQGCKYCTSSGAQSQTNSNGDVSSSLITADECTAVSLRVME